MLDGEVEVKPIEAVRLAHLQPLLLEHEGLLNVALLVDADGDLVASDCRQFLVHLVPYFLIAGDLGHPALMLRLVQASASLNESVAVDLGVEADVDHTPFVVLVLRKADFVGELRRNLVRPDVASRPRDRINHTHDVVLACGRVRLAQDLALGDVQLGKVELLALGASFAAAPSDRSRASIVVTCRRCGTQGGAGCSIPGVRVWVKTGLGLSTIR